MRKLIFIVLLLNYHCVLGQKGKPINTEGYARVPNSPVHVFKTDSFKYLRYDGYEVIDIRKASPVQLIDIKNRERISNLEKNRFWGLYANSYQDRFPRHSLALRFEQNTGAKIYAGIRWKWGTL
ncbi:MAG TPA: hypothetical protein VL088_00305, partial [Pedobacter sp.]|nr:hypothetical protein [Pedobacter sp.]